MSGQLDQLGTVDPGALVFSRSHRVDEIARKSPDKRTEQDRWVLLCSFVCFSKHMIFIRTFMAPRRPFQGRGWQTNTRSLTNIKWGFRNSSVRHLDWVN
jgi:hypothetical protein